MKFFVILNNQQEGPYTIAQLAEMGISAETLVWKEGMKDWQPAWTVSELRYILNEKTNEYRNASCDFANHFNVNCKLDVIDKPDSKTALENNRDISVAKLITKQSLIIK